MITFLQFDVFPFSTAYTPLNEIRPVDWPFPTDERILSLYDVKLAGPDRRLFTPRYTQEQIRKVLVEGQRYSVWAVSYRDGEAIWWAGDIRIQTIDDEGITYDL